MAVKLKVKVGDTVKVISGEDKNSKDNTGKVQKVFPETGRIIVEGINMVKKHQKPRGQGMPGGIIEKEAAIDASNVMVICRSAASPPVSAMCLSKAKARPLAASAACARSAKRSLTTDVKGGLAQWLDYWISTARRLCRRCSSASRTRT